MKIFDLFSGIKLKHNFKSDIHLDPRIDRLQKIPIFFSFLLHEKHGTPHPTPIYKCHKTCSGNWIFHRQKGGGVNDFTIYTACLVFLYSIRLGFLLMFICLFRQTATPLFGFLLLFICLFGQRVWPEMIAGVYNTHVSSVPFDILDVKLYKSNSKKQKRNTKNNYSREFYIYFSLVHFTN